MTASLAQAGAGRAGGGAGLPTVLNAANEVAVEAFLAGRIAFGGMRARGGGYRRGARERLRERTRHGGGSARR